MGKTIFWFGGVDNNMSIAHIIINSKKKIWDACQRLMMSHRITHHKVSHLRVWDHLRVLSYSLFHWHHWRLHQCTWPPIKQIGTYNKNTQIYILIRYWVVLSVCLSVHFAIETTFPLSNFETKHTFGILMDMWK